MAEAAGARPREQRVVVVGAGIGGLVAALLLAARGVGVTLVEAAATPGGKMRRQLVDGVGIDGGPTVFTMRWVFEQLLDEAGASLSALPRMQPLSVLARHAWRGHERTLDLHADRAASADAIGRFAGADEARRFEAFCRRARVVYGQLEGPYLRSPRPTLPGFVRALGVPGIAALASLGPMASLRRAVAREFRDPRLVQLFSRYATYCGASPWRAPATLVLVAQVEMDGVWAVEGGLHALATAVARLAQQKGVRFVYGRRVDELLVRGGQVCGVRLDDGLGLAADGVVWNGDPGALCSGLAGEAAKAAVPGGPVPRGARSLSAVTWAMHARTEGSFPLARHNVFFDDDYAAEFHDVFRRRRLPERGTVYVCAQDRSDDARPHAGPERLLALVNAPADGDRRPFHAMETDPCEQRCLQLLRDCGLEPKATPQQVQRTTPADFERLFPGSGGALYGRATHGWMTPFTRPGAATRLPGLVLAGGGVHPGPGVPMAAMSGRWAAEALMEHLASTRRWHPAATAGGMSMPSATTAPMH